MPLKEVFLRYPRELLIAGGSRIGSDVLYALVVVFTLTYVTTVLQLPRPLALMATMVGAIGNALTRCPTAWAAVRCTLPARCWLLSGRLCFLSCSTAPSRG